MAFKGKVSFLLGIVSAVLLSAALVTAAGCKVSADSDSGNDVGTVLVTGIAVNAADSIIDLDDTTTYPSSTTVTATVSPDGATNKSVTWSSSNDSYATVDSIGTVTAVANGVVTIYATAKDGSGVKGSAQIKVGVESTVVSATGVTVSASGSATSI